MNLPRNRKQIILAKIECFKRQLSAQEVLEQEELLAMNWCLHFFLSEPRR